MQFGLAYEMQRPTLDDQAVVEETIEQWIENGMPLTDDGRIFKDWLDLYSENNGKPSEEDKRKKREEIEKYLLGAIGQARPGPQSDTDSEMVW